MTKPFTNTTIGQAIAVRYAIDDDLWRSFTVEQVRKQIKCLRETGRFREPNNGGAFVVRVSQYALSGEDQYADQILYDFSFNSEALTDMTCVTRWRCPGSLKWTAQQREEEERALAEALWDEVVVQIWWERDYVCVRSRLPPPEWEDREVAWMAANVVVILLQDRTANKIEVAPSKRPKLNLNFIKRRPQIPDSENAPEIVLTIPRRVYTSSTSGKSKPHGPHRMHYRAEHVRQQQYGPRSAPSYREKVIAGMWINADDVSPEDRGTPITRNYKFKALRIKAKRAIG